MLDGDCFGKKRLAMTNYSDFDRYKNPNAIALSKLHWRIILF